MLVICVMPFVFALNVMGGLLNVMGGGGGGKEAAGVAAAAGDGNTEKG